MGNGFIFGDRSTADFHMKAERYPIQRTPYRKGETISVEGRNGDLHIWENAYANYIQPYECYFREPGKPMPLLAHEVKAWLMARAGYHRLEDAYDPGHFRLASFAGPMDIENILNKYGRCTVEFDCCPQSFLTSGEQAITFEVPGILTNPTAFEALPLITVYGNGEGIVTIGSTVVQVYRVTEPIILDCDSQNAYSQPGEGAPVNCNNDILAIPFPSLLPGDNAISFSGDITKIEIIPRWWEL